MSWHALQKRVRGLFNSRRQQSPPSSPYGQPCAAATGASELNEKVQGRLHRAAARGDLAWLRRWRWYFKRIGMDPPDQQRRTPLHLASENGHADVVRYLAGKNCKLNLADGLKRTPLMRAVQCQQEECVAILLEHGADPNLADADGNTALHLAVLSGNTTVAGLLFEHNASSDAQNQRGYTPLNLAVSKQHEEMVECLVKKAADRHAAEQCERTALVVTRSHQADVEEDNLHLQEELEKVKAELREVEEKHRNCERCIENLMAALVQNEREELAAAQELQDQLSAYFENQTTVKRLEEHVKRLEIKNTSLEATVHRQSDRIEALLRDLQASASLQEVEEKHRNCEHCIENLMAASDEKDKEELAAAQELQDQLSAYFENHTTVKQLEEQVLSLEIQNTRLEATVHQQNHRIEALLRDLQASASLREVEEKHRNSERCIENLMAASDEKDKEELAAAQELQDQLSAYFENQTTVKQLEEQVLSFEIQNTRLEATVHQQNHRIEALLRDLQASASLREVEEKHRNCEHCIENLTAASDEKDKEELAAAQELQDQLSAYFENQTTVKQLEEQVLSLEIQNTRLEATVHQQNHRIEALLRDLQASASLQEVEEKHLNCERCMKNLMAALDEKERETTACALKLQDQVSEYLETVKQLEEHVQRLGFEKTSLEATVQQQSNRIEALQRELQATTSAQAASQDRLQHITGEVEKYKELYLKEVKIRKCQAKELERANKRLEEANAKFLQKRHKITSSIVSGGLAATPVLYSTALGHPGNSSGLDRSVSLEGSFLSQCEKILSSRKRLAASVAKVQQEQEEKITEEVRKAAAELETGFSRSSKKFH